MVDFAGTLPIQYQDPSWRRRNIVARTRRCSTCRTCWGRPFEGRTRRNFGIAVVADLKGLKDGTGTLSVMTNERGGIIDDTVITKVNMNDYYVVLNAGCAEKDQAHINAALAKAKANGMDVDFIVHSDRSLLAFQGPKAMEVLQRVTEFDLSKLYFGMFTSMKVNRETRG